MLVLLPVETSNHYLILIYIHIVMNIRKSTVDLGSAMTGGSFSFVALYYLYGTGVIITDNNYYV